MTRLAHGYPVTGCVEEEEAETGSARFFRFKAPRAEDSSRWQGVLVRDLNSLHPQARMRFADPFLLRAPIPGHAGIRRRLRAQGLRLPAGIVLPLDPVLPAGARCAGCASEHRCAGQALSYGRLHRIVAQGRALGVRLFLCLARELPRFREELVDLALRYPDCAFLLLSPEAPTEEGFLQELAEAGNAALVLPVDGFALETDSLRGPGAYDAFTRAMAGARSAGLPFGFAGCYYNGNAPTLFSRGFLEGLIEGGALFGLYYPYSLPRASSGVQLRDTALRLQAARERYPVSLLDLRLDVSFGGAGPAENLPVHWAGPELAHLTLLESLEQAALPPRDRALPADPKDRSCPLRTDPQWAKDALARALAQPYRRSALSRGETSNAGQ